MHRRTTGLRRAVGLLAAVALVALAAGCNTEAPTDGQGQAQPISPGTSRPAAAAAEAVVHAGSAAEFEAKVLRAETPVLVDFYATWCGPCVRMAPIFREVAAQYQGKVAFVKLDIDRVGSVAQRYGIRSIPTLIVFKGGEEVRRVVGLQSAAQLKAACDAVAGQ